METIGDKPKQTLIILIQSSPSLFGRIKEDISCLIGE
jgi:hypothetical protein